MVAEITNVAVNIFDIMDELIVGHRKVKTSLSDIFFRGFAYYLFKQICGFSPE
jgi:hypothetical protein